MTDISDLDVFIAVVKAGTISGAARQLELAPVSVKKRLTQLETDLGNPLMVRHGRSLALTQQGKGLFYRLLTIYEDLTSTIEELSDPDDRLTGSLRILSSLGFGRRRLEQLVLAFSQEHPALSVVLHLEDRPLNFVRDGYDVAVVVGLPPDANLVAQRFIMNPCHMVASPQYLEQAPPLLTPEDLRHHRCLVLDCAGAYRDSWPLRGKGRQEAWKVQPWLLTDDSEILHHWLLQGEGIGIVTEIDGAADIQAGRLVPVLTEYRVPNQDFFILHGPALNLPARTRRFVAFLEQAFARDPNLAPPQLRQG